jgi:excisionase family DNA binding protein
MARSRSYRYRWHPDRPHDSEKFPVPPDGQLSTAEAATLLGLSDGGDVRRLITAGELPAFRDGRQWRLRYEDVLRLQQKLRTKHRDFWCPWPTPEGHDCKVSVSLTKLKTLAPSGLTFHIRKKDGTVRTVRQDRLTLLPDADSKRWVVCWSRCLRAPKSG